MPDSMRGYLQRDIECEALLECFHGLRDLDRRVFGLLVETGEPLTVDELSDRIDRERSTAYRSVQRLMDAGLVEKRQVNYDHGGYYHVYEPADPDEIADEMQRMLNDWYAKMGQLIGEFRGEYAHVEAADTDAEPETAAPPADQ
ncbi:helix-turn-helix domain-containing protein [Halobacterium noricense]|uniref:helix-turn-helix domain-containing protein n=1 Tax=Halobacterium noricense TaxID=223182 RepID=UPI001E63D57A|nr:helix-turn-helix domain-containing protein [Halobacterium noricense]UHH25206.1 MarR family transcriptional regulator [Halobacterium noricense]